MHHHRPATQQSNVQSHDQNNNRHGHDRQDGSDNHRNNNQDSGNNDKFLLNFSLQPLGGVVMSAECFSPARLPPPARWLEGTHAQVSSGPLTRKPVFPAVFCNYADQPLNIQVPSPCPQSLSGTALQIKELKDQLRSCGARFYSPEYIAWGARFVARRRTGSMRLCIGLPALKHFSKIDLDWLTSVRVKEAGHFQDAFAHVMVIMNSVMKKPRDLRTVLQILRQEKLYTKFSKCKFWLSKVVFLGHVVPAEGITMDLAKVEVVINARSKSEDEARSFSGVRWSPITVLLKIIDVILEVFQWRSLQTTRYSVSDIRPFSKDILSFHDSSPELLCFPIFMSFAMILYMFDFKTYSIARAIYTHDHDLHDLPPSHGGYLAMGFWEDEDVLRMRATLRLTLLYGLPHVYAI
ncbi:hypothetical protein Tco_0578034 [Tanacetum coccineum]